MSLKLVWKLRERRKMLMLLREFYVIDIKNGYVNDGTPGLLHRTSDEIEFINSLLGENG